MSDLISAKTLAHAMGLPVDGKAFRSRLRTLIDAGTFAEFNDAHASTPIVRVGAGHTYGYTDEQAIEILQRMRAQQGSQTLRKAPVDVERASSLIAAIEDGLLDNADADDDEGLLDDGDA